MQQSSDYGFEDYEFTEAMAKAMDLAAVSMAPRAVITNPYAQRPSQPMASISAHEAANPLWSTAPPTNLIVQRQNMNLNM
jgi:hypothetical protein